MNFNTFLIQLVCVSCGVMLLQARRVARGWLVVASFILLVLGVAYVLSPAWAGWISGGVWTILLLLPLVGHANVNRLVSQERFGQARRLASWVRWLHPADGLLEYPQLLQGLELGQQGRVDEAMRLFERYQTTTALGRTARAMLFRMGARWHEAIAWIRQELPEATIFNDVTVALTYLRSLGETGDLNGLLQGVEQFERRYGQGEVSTLRLGRMFALAFCGQTHEVKQLFDGSLAVYSKSAQQYWLATAEQAAGHAAFARQQLLALLDRADPIQRHAIAWRLSQPPVDLEQELTDASRKLLIQFRVETAQAAQYSFQRAVRWKKIYVTYLLIAANLFMFWLELDAGGSHNPETLYRLGALIPELILTGEWWRILTANFLHLNWMHLLANMLGLYILGRFVEAVLGTGRFLLIYFFSGLGAMLTVAILALMTAAPVFVVGASGAIMGLLGAMAAIFLRGWQRERAAIAGRQLLWLLILVGIQIIFDLFVPESSLIGHVSGLILGFIAGYGLSGNRSPRKIMKR